MRRVPLIVIGGYLGAGKTTLVTELIRGANGRRLTILVNDFGALDIDKDMIAAADGDTIALSNGCVCCAMTGDLYYAIGDALDRRPQPDAIVVEASGVADPARIAAVARTEPELLPGGIVTVVDCETIGVLLEDPQIGEQIAAQIRAADLVALSRTDRADDGAALKRLATLTDAPIVAAPHGKIAPDLVLGLASEHVPESHHDHHHGDIYASWHCDRSSPITQAALDALMADPPPGLFRLKGWIALDDGTAREIHKVGRRWDIRRAESRTGCRLVAIGLAGRFDPAAMQTTFERLCEIGATTN